MNYSVFILRLLVPAGCLLLLSCTSSRIPLEKWEKGAKGTYKVSYSAGLHSGAEMMVLSYGDSWKGTVYGPLHVPVFSLDVSPSQWTLVYSGKSITFPPCAFMKGDLLENVLNGEFKEIPPDFECQGWGFTWDSWAGRLMGMRPDGRSLFVVFSAEHPVAHISVELPQDDLYLEFIQEDIYKPKVKP